MRLFLEICDNIADREAHLVPILIIKSHLIRNHVRQVDLILYEAGFNRRLGHARSWKDYLCVFVFFVAVLTRNRTLPWQSLPNIIGHQNDIKNFAR